MDILTRIYVLVNPKNDEIFCVGRTHLSLKLRLKSHFRDARHDASPRALKIAEIVSDGVKPEIAQVALLVNASQRQINECEQAWIDFYRLTCKLTNVNLATSGGKGAITRTKYDWTAEILSRLGKEPDTCIAKDTGFPVHTVGYKRQVLGIPAYNIKTIWTSEILSRLGKQTDISLAIELKCGVGTVGAKRKELGITKYQMPVKKGEDYGKHLPDWVLEQIGTMSDAALASLAGVSPYRITTARKKLEIVSYAELAEHPTRFNSQDVKPTLFPENMIHLLGTMPDTQLASHLELGRKVVRLARLKRNIPAFCGLTPEQRLPESVVSRMGKVSDKTLARELGRAKREVTKMRRKLGIKAFEKKSCYETVEVVNRLGKECDAYIARDLNCHPTSIKQLRTKLGIPRFARKMRNLK